MMGEYVKYKGAEVKIGTLENLYYVSYSKFKEAFEKGLVKPSEFSVHPAKCLEANSGFLFRFPFPDEDKLAFGEIGDHRFDRGIPIKILPGRDEELMELAEKNSDREFTINLIQQKFVLRESDGAPIMATVFREPRSSVAFRVEGEKDIQKIVGQIVRNHIFNEQDKNLKQQYMLIASLILKGYGLNPEQVIAKHIERIEKQAKRSRKMDDGLGI